MARKTRMVTVKSERVEILEIICDLCEKTAPEPDSESGNPWTAAHGEVANTTIEMELGDGDLEEGTVKVTSFDICPECFKTKLIPFFAEEGGRLPFVRLLDT